MIIGFEIIIILKFKWKPPSPYIPTAHSCYLPVVMNMWHESAEGMLKILDPTGDSKHRKNGGKSFQFSSMNKTRFNVKTN